jgi:hypothetical protein
MKLEDIKVGMRVAWKETGELALVTAVNGDGFELNDDDWWHYDPADVEPVNGIFVDGFLVEEEPRPSVAYADGSRS